MIDAFEELRVMRDRIDRMAENVWRSGMPRGINMDATMLVPCMDVSEKDGNLLIEMDMPGVSKEDINIKLTEVGLSVQANRKSEKEDKRDDYYRAERTWSSYGRTTSLPFKIDPEKAEAEFKDGCLKIKVPLAEEKRKEKTVKLKVN